MSRESFPPVDDSILELLPAGAADGGCSGHIRLTRESHHDDYRYVSDYYEYECDFSDADGWRLFGYKSQPSITIHWHGGDYDYYQEASLDRNNYYHFTTSFDSRNNPTTKDVTKVIARFAPGKKIHVSLSDPRAGEVSPVDPWRFDWKFAGEYGGTTVLYLPILDLNLGWAVDHYERNGETVEIKGTGAQSYYDAPWTDHQETVELVAVVKRVGCLVTVKAPDVQPPKAKAKGCDALPEVDRFFYVEKDPSYPEYKQSATLWTYNAQNSHCKFKHWEVDGRVVSKTDRFDLVVDRFQEEDYEIQPVAVFDTYSPGSDLPLHDAQGSIIAMPIEDAGGGAMVAYEQWVKD